MDWRNDQKGCTTCTVKPLYSGNPWDRYKCPDYRGVLVSGVNLYYKAQFGTFVSVLRNECPHFTVSSIEGFHCNPKAANIVTHIPPRYVYKLINNYNNYNNYNDYTIILQYTLSKK